MFALAFRSLFVASVLAGSCLAADPTGAERTLSIADVLALSAAEIDAGVRVRVQGTVTLCDIGAVIQDGRHGLWLTGVGIEQDAQGRMLAAARDGSRQLVTLGTRLEVAGLVDRGGFAPKLVADPAAVTIVGTASLPEPVPFDPDRVLRGGDNAVRVEIGRDQEVIVQGCEDGGDTWRLMLDLVGRRLQLRIDKRLLPDRPAQLVDASIRAVVLPTAARNSRGQFLLPEFLLAAAADLEVVKPAPFSPFESPSVPLAALGTYRASPPSRHRIQTEGTVTGVLPGRAIYLQEGLTGVHVTCADTAGIAVGDRVRVAGFIGMVRQMAGILDGIVERVSSGQPLAATATTPDEIRGILRTSATMGEIARPSNFAGVLVTFPATLVERQASRDGWLLTLSAGNTTLNARLVTDQDASASLLAELEPGTKLAVTGVVELGMERLLDSDFSSDYPEDDSLELVLRSPDDLRVLERPSWWTPRRLAVALGGLAAGLALAVGWVVLLRREVARQSERIAAEQQTRREAAVEYQATLRERSRLAANLHDTVLQTVTGIGYQLEVCEGALAHPAGDVAAKLAVADKMVGHAVQQLRGTVWALRTAAPSNRPLPEALADLADRVQGSHEAVIVVQAAGDPVPRIADFVAGNLLLVAQEAMLNALRHGHANRIDVDLSFDADSGQLVLVVRDDGRGFELGSQPGPRQGHFGIEGMRERVERLGGSLAIETAFGSGTSLRVTVPLEAGGQHLAAAAAAT